MDRAHRRQRLRPRRPFAGNQSRPSADEYYHATIDSEKKDILRPWIDEDGLWSQLRIVYDGKLRLTLNIQLKWIHKKRRSGRHSTESVSPASPQRQSAKEEIAEHQRIKRRWRQRLWPPRNWFRRQRSVSKRSRSADPKKKAPRTTLVIKFEVSHLQGTVLLNVPPMPSDRLWFSFLDMPDMQFSVGDEKRSLGVPVCRSSLAGDTASRRIPRLVSSPSR